MSNDDAVTGLALAAGRGDRAALSEFIRLTQADVWRFVAHQAGPDVADDLTQETFLRMHGALSRFEGRSSARTWLLAIARRVIVDQVRHELARPRLVFTGDWRDAGDANPEHVDLTASLRLGELLAILEPGRREALVLTQLMGFTYAETAQICGCALGTVRSRVARARADLVTAMAREEGLAALA